MIHLSTFPVLTSPPAVLKAISVPPEPVAAGATGYEGAAARLYAAFLGARGPTIEDVAIVLNYCAAPEQPTPPTATPCHRCAYSNSNASIVCAVHPLGRPEGECNDWEDGLTQAAVERWEASEARTRAQTRRGSIILGHEEAVAWLVGDRGAHLVRRTTVGPRPNQGGEPIGP